MLNEIAASPVFGLLLCLSTFFLGTLVQKKTGWVLANPLMISVALCIAFLCAFSIPYESFSKGADFLHALMGPATAVLAVNIYEQRRVLRQYFWPVVGGCLAGSLTSLLSVTLLCRLFLLEDSIFVSLLPKSCTTAIAVGIAESRGGLAAITVVAVIFTGFLGAVFAPLWCRLFHIKSAVAQGLAVGASSHALGTTKAIEMGAVQGSMSGIALSVCGMMTVVLTFLMV